MAEVTLIVAFIAGLVSFLSPCVLPIIPGFLAYLAGASLQEAKEHRWDIFLNSVFFVLGFSVVFAVLGILLNTLLQNVAYEVQTWLSRLGGTIIIIFGLYLTGLVNIPFLEKEHKLKVKWKFKSKYLTSFLFGLAFAVGWTPCVSIILGSILGLAASQPGIAFSLLLSYAIGLGVPFMVTGLFATQATEIIHKFGKWIKYVNIVFGVLLIILGILAFTQNLTLIANLEFVNRLVLS